MNKKNKVENYLNELKRLSNKKRDAAFTAGIPRAEQRLSKEREESNKRDKIIKSKYSRIIRPKYSMVTTQGSRTKEPSNNFTKTRINNPNRNLENLYYRAAIKSLDNKTTTKLDLPRGCFNAGLAEYPAGGYVCVYRPDEYSFAGCFLNNDYSVVKTKKHHKFKFTNCADPRLLWIENNTKLLMVYSSTTEGRISKECIKGMIIMDLNNSDSFIDSEQFRISPEGDERHKNWMPFLHDNEIFLISNVSNHKIYHLDIKNKNCKLQYENNWFCPWPIKEDLRGNTNAVKLDNGNYLSTFHTAVWEGKRCHYDNGIYLFEGKPPFKVLKCSNKTYLPAEDAIEPHFRKANSILCPFPVGMVVKKDKVIISYGDNDSCVKILETNLEDLNKLMLEVY